MKEIIPESGSELKSPHNKSWTGDGEEFGRKWRLASSKTPLRAPHNIITWINFTSQNSGSQWICAVHTSNGWCTWFTSGGNPKIKKIKANVKVIINAERIKYKKPRLIKLKHTRM